MSKFIGERIDVDKSDTSPTPIRFTWRGKVHEVAEVLNERVDIGFGALPHGSRKWYNRRHRRYYVVKDSQGEVFEIYLDYANPKRQTWWLKDKRD
jgi:hypothetical protein